MRSEKYRNRQNPETIRPKKDDYWEETQILFRNKEELKEEVRQQNQYEERRARAAAYKEYLAMRENPDGNRSPEASSSARRQMTPKIIPCSVPNSPILKIKAFSTSDNMFYLRC